MLTVELTCTRCHESFKASVDHYRVLNYDRLPNRCPKCCDELQERPDIVLERRTLQEFTCIVDESMACVLSTMEKHQPLDTDTPSYRFTRRGRDYGTIASGRIDLYGLEKIPSIGDVITFAHQECHRRVWYIERARWIAGMTLDARQVTITRRVGKDHVLKEGERGPFERLETNEYYVMLPTNQEASPVLPRLCWLSCYSKTTLKGFGAQYSYKIVGKPLFSVSIDGGVRSGRAYTHSMLAIVDPADPLKIVGGLEASDEEEFIPSNPSLTKA